MNFEKELFYNNSMNLKELKDTIKFFEREGTINDNTEVIIGKHGTSALVDGPKVQKKATDADIQVVPGGDFLSPGNNHSIAFTIVHK